MASCLAPCQAGAGARASCLPECALGTLPRIYRCSFRTSNEEYYFRDTVCQVETEVGPRQARLPRRQRHLDVSSYPLKAGRCFYGYLRFLRGSICSARFSRLQHRDLHVLGPVVSYTFSHYAQRTFESRMAPLHDSRCCRLPPQASLLSKHRRVSVNITDGAH